MAQQKGIFMDTSYGLHYASGATHMDHFPESLRSVVSDHWAQFPPQHPLFVDIFGLIFMLLTFISVLGNGLVIYIFLSSQKLRSPTNIFIVNLAISDIGIMLTQGPMMVINAFTSDFWIWGPFLCKLYGCTGGIFGGVSILTMIVIGYDRYNVIVKGFGGVKMTVGKAISILIVIWAYSVAIHLTPFFGWGDYSLEGLYMTCSFDYLSEDWNRQSFVWFALIFNYIIPITFNIYFYSQIVAAVCSHEAKLRSQAKVMKIDSVRTGEEAETRAEFRIAKVAITNVLLWFVIWTPYALIVILPNIGLKHFVTPISSQLPSFFAKFASVFNPWVYAISHPKFREAIAIKVPCLGIGKRPKTSEDSDCQTAEMKPPVHSGEGQSIA